LIYYRIIFFFAINYVNSFQGAELFVIAQAFLFSFKFILKNLQPYSKSKLELRVQHGQNFAS